MKCIICRILFSLLYINVIFNLLQLIIYYILSNFVFNVFKKMIKTNKYEKIRCKRKLKLNRFYNLEKV